MHVFSTEEKLLVLFAGGGGGGGGGGGVRLQLFPTGGTSERAL